MQGTIDQQHMKRCLDLASRGLGYVQPNPLVGCVIARGLQTLAEGYHTRFGAAHAEIEALQNLSDNFEPEACTLYVNLEPCCHSGKTPPCTDAILSSGIKRIVVGCTDPNPLVSGGGLKILRDHQLEVVVGVLESECHELNRRFETFQVQKRPYVILKWAQTSDGFIARDDLTSKWISSEESRLLVHRWRHEEAAILVGSRTAKIDNPQLSVRHLKGINPVRMVIDRKRRLPKQLKIFDTSIPTFVLCDSAGTTQTNLDFLVCDFEKPLAPQVLAHCYKLGLSSLIVEGGSTTLQHFIDSQCWDEARVFVSPRQFGSGIMAPNLRQKDTGGQHIGGDELLVYRRRNYQAAVTTEN